MKKPLVIGLLLAAIVALASYVAAGPYLALHSIRTALADELLFGRLADGGHVTVDLDDASKVVLKFDEENVVPA